MPFVVSGVFRGCLRSRVIAWWLPRRVFLCCVWGAFYKDERRDTFEENMYNFFSTLK